APVTDSLSLLSSHHTAPPMTSTLSLHDALPDLIFGTVNDPAMHGEIRVTVIATGFDRPAARAETASRAAPGVLPFRERGMRPTRSEEHTSELQSRFDLVCRLLLEKKKHTERMQI